MDKEQWLEARKKGITGTDIAAIAGISRFRNALDVWYEKRGLAQPIPENDAMKWGTLQEPIIAHFYAERNGVELENPGLIGPGHPYWKEGAREWLIGTPDRLVVDQDKGLEIKTARRRSEKMWGEPGTDQIPDDYYVQCQWYMLVLNFPVWDLAVKIDSSDYREYTILANTALQNKLYEIAGEFWEKNVIGGETPVPKGGGAFPSEYLAQQKDDGVMLEFADKDAIKLASAYSKALAAYDEAEARRKALRSQLEALIGEASGIEGAGYRITWKRSKDTQVVDWEAVAKEAGATEALISKHTKEKRGARVFRFREVDDGEL